MFTANINSTDRVIRLILGLVLISLAFFGPQTHFLKTLVFTISDDFKTKQTQNAPKTRPIQLKTFQILIKILLISF